MTAQIQAMNEPHLIIKIATGIRSHWSIRISEWAMLWPAIGMGLAMKVQPDMFARSKGFLTLASWGNEDRWAAIVLMCALIRLIALTVNGTFDTFRYSPHLRFAASLVGIAFWSQFCLGIMTSAVNDGAPLSESVAYSTLVILELANLYRSGGDIGKHLERLARELR